MSITVILPTDLISNSRTTINDNFADLDTTKADLASPVFTGNPIAPTQSAQNNSTRIATTAYVDSTKADTLGIALVTWLPLDFAQTTLDASVTRATVTVTTPALQATGGPDLNGDYLFNGTADFLSLPHNANQLLVNGFSMSAWIFPTSLGESNGGRIFDKSSGTGGQTGWTWNVGGTNALQIRVNNVATVNSASNSITLSAWNHVLTTIATDGTATHYINGVASGTPTVAGACSGITTTNALTIGNRSTATDRSFAGSITKTRLYSRVLSAAEINQLYVNKL